MNWTTVAQQRAIQEPVNPSVHMRHSRPGTKTVILPIEQASASSVRNHAFFGMNQDDAAVETVIDGLRNGRY